MIGSTGNAADDGFAWGLRAIGTVEPTIEIGSYRLHDRVVSNIRAVLSNRVRGSHFQVFGRGERVLVTPQVTLSPDLMLARVGAPGEGVLDPLVVIEVISPDSARHDRVLKNRVYRSVPALRQYLMAATDRPRIETVTRWAEGWTTDAVTGLDGRVSLPGHGLDLFLSDVYAETGLT